MDIKYSWIEFDKIQGTVIYDSCDAEEQQDFCWHIKEEEVPTSDVIELIRIIKQNKFIDGDKIVVSEDIIFERTGWSDRDKFNLIMDKLYEIEIKMVDDGEETDIFYLHN